MRKGRAPLRAAAATALVLLGGTASAETRIAADVGTSIGYSSNPFSTDRNSTFGPTGGSFYYELTAQPRVSWVGATSTLTASGNIRYQDYLRAYDSADSYGAALDHSAKPTERLTTHLNLSYDSAVLGAGRGIGLGAGGSAGGGGTATPVDPGVIGADGNDIGLFGSRTRSINYTAAGDLAYALSGRDNFTASAFASAARYKSRQVSNDYESYGGSFGYQRKFSQALTLGARASISRYDYRTALTPDSQIIAIQGTVQYRPNERFSASGELGTTLIDDQGGTGGTSAALSGSLRLCSKGQLDEFCVSGSRSVVPTGFAGTRTQSSAGADYSRKLNERTSISARGSYVHSGAGNATGAATRNSFGSDYIDASIGAQHQLGDRLSLSASGFYRRVTGGGRDIPDSVGGLISVSYRLGNRQ